MQFERDVVEDLKDLNGAVCRLLWNLADVGEEPPVLGPHVVVPKTRAGAGRISEQEARFAFVEAVSSSPYYYAVETPTKQRYKGHALDETGRSAMIDMSLYLPNPKNLTCAANVELKHGTPDADAIAGDLGKLIGEGSRADDGVPCGNWFLVMQGAGRATVASVADEFAEAAAMLPSVSFGPGHVRSVVCLCALERRTALKWARIGEIAWTGNAAAFAGEASRLFSLTPTGSGATELSDAFERAGWTAVRA
ncbi:MAG: hypothetical protein NT029_07185 [Armatimonadetes bacterium]|nr:hypothetical protein [Armatimonadota bacterium]